MRCRLAFTAWFDAPPVHDASEISESLTDYVQDWHDGKIPYYTLPPERGSVVKGSAEVVSAWAQEFDADQVSCPPFLPLPQGPQHTASTFAAQ